MKIKMLKCIAVFMVVLLVAGASISKGSTKLRVAFTPGKVLHYVSNEEQKITISWSSQEITQNEKQITNFTHKVENIDGKGNAAITLSIDRIRRTQSNPQGAVNEYDTASKEKPKGSAKIDAMIFDSLTKQPIKIKGSPLGKISELKMPKGFSDALKKVSGIIAQEGAPPLTEDDFIDIGGICHGGVVFPEEAVYEGKTWTIEGTENLPGLGNQTVRATYCYLGKENKDGKDLDKISKTAVLKSANNNKNSDIKSLSTEATIYFDNGVMVEYESHSKIKMEQNKAGNQRSKDWDLTQTTKLVSTE